MASRLNPYISFDGNAREALDFYRSVLGGTVAVNTFGEYGDATAPEADKIMHGVLETDAGFTLMCGDNPPGADAVTGNNISVSLSGDDEAQLRGYWDKLSEGATVQVPLDKQRWGDVFGMCTDRFGIAWMVNITQSQT